MALSSSCNYAIGLKQDANKQKNFTLLSSMSPRRPELPQPKDLKNLKPSHWMGPSERGGHPPEDRIIQAPRGGHENTFPSRDWQAQGNTRRTDMAYKA